ncbi:MAG: alcohol dehydrogenase catalytic domain-containing protein [Planctomycetes bacterium]|nr:alcohol dehydrogenase catalytic domain-containing protein [Planctomycetota bacterium]
MEENDLPKTMLAIVKTRAEPGAEYREVRVPEVGPDDVLVRVEAGAICGTDIHIYEWNAWAQENMQKAYSALPRIMGHEFSGTVVHVGKNVRKVKPGDRVAAETHIACGECYLCRTGNEYNCQYLKRFKDGVYGQYAVVPAYSAEKLGDNVPSDIGALMEPFGVAVHAASKTAPVGDTVAVIGCGPIGLLMIKVLRAMGAATIFASDVSDYRLAMAQKFGADVAINPTREDPVQVVRDATGGYGAGHVFENSGNVRAAKQAFELLRRCGTMVMTGLPSEPLRLDAGPDIVWKGAKIFGSYGRDNFTTWEIARGLLDTGRVRLDDIITHRFAFSDYQEAFAIARQGQSGKILLHP